MDEADLARLFEGLRPTDRLRRATQVAASIERFIDSVNEQEVTAERSEIAFRKGAAVALRAIAAGY